MTVQPRRTATRARARLAAALVRAREKVFPGHWSFLLGEIAMFSFLVLVATGVFLAFAYEASGETVEYDGSHAAMQGVEVSAAYASVMDITFDTPGGALIRQTHHWAAVVFVAAIVLHAARVFFTGGFRRPRRLNWMIGVTLLGLSMAAGFFGLALPHDLLGGTGARIGHAVLVSIPVVGPGVVDLLFGGEFGNPDMLHRFWLLHVVVLPTLIAAHLAGHLALVWLQTHTQFGDQRRHGDHVVGNRAWPGYALKSGGLAMVVVGTLVVMGAVFQIAPIWLYGPFDAAASTVPAQPDWYLGWIEGALRIVPSVELVIVRWEIPNAFFVGFLLPAAVFLVLYVWPFAEARITHDTEPRHLLERPRDRPIRTSLGVAGLTVLTVLTLAGSHDLAALLVRVPVDQVTTLYRWLLAIAPPIAGLLTYWTCRALVITEREQLGRDDRRVIGRHVEREDAR